MNTSNHQTEENNSAFDTQLAIGEKNKKSWWKYFPVLKIAGILLGGIGGYLYYYFVGCTNGSCPITSNPWITTGYGMLLGYLLFDSVKLNKDEQNKNIN